MIQLIISLVSFIFGFFVKKKVSEAESLKKQVKQYEDQMQSEQEINKRTVDNYLIDHDTALLQFKKNRADHSNR